MITFSKGSVRHEFFIFPDQTGTATSSPVFTAPSRVDIAIPNVMLWMKKNAYEDTTIHKAAKLLRHLQRQKNCSLTDPESIKLYVANKKCSNGHKENLVEAYNYLMMANKRGWDKPFYQRYSKKRKAPREELVDFLIDHARIEMGTKLSISKDLGQRPIELTWLTIKDIDLTTGIVSITGAKHTIGREGKLKQKSLTLLKILIETKRLTQSSHIYNGTSDNLSANYRHYRNRIAKEFNMPQLKQVQLYDFRRFKASKEYRLSRNNLIHVSQILGHKDTRMTERYISILESRDLQWIPVVCTTDEEIQQAIRDDYELVCQADGKTYFKKPA